MENLANVWSEGGLFAFSGVDGETCHAEPFVASGSKGAIGWRFWLQPRVEFTACVGTRPLISCRAQSDFCLADCWRCTASSTEFPSDEDTGLVEGAFIDRASMTVLLTFPSSSEGQWPDLSAEGGDAHSDGVTLWTGQGWWLALCKRPEAKSRRFGVAISYANADEAVARARNACETSLEQATRARLEFYSGVNVPDAVTDNNRRAYFRAVTVQKVNVESPQLDMPCRWTTPDRMPHRHMWLWDSAFHSLGLQHHSTDLAEDALRALFAKQRADGKLSLAAQPGAPPPEGEDTQPPIVAWSLCRQNERNTHTDFIAEVYPRLVQYLDWFEWNRKKENGLYGWRVRHTEDPICAARGGESGMDNSPRFDNVTAMTAVDLSSYMASEYYNMEKLARCLDKADDAAEWREHRRAIAERINTLLWDDETRFYYDLDEHGDIIRLKSVAGFTPLLAQAPDRDRAEALRTHLMNPNEFWSPFPIPSISQDEPSYCKDMWRGPTWPNMNVLIYYGLMAYGFFQEARDIARITVREITRHYMQHGCVYEYYDSAAETCPPDLPRKGAPGELGGVGFGVVADLHWTAASYVHFTHELY